MANRVALLDALLSRDGFARLNPAVEPFVEMVDFGEPLEFLGECRVVNVE